VYIKYPACQAIFLLFRFFSLFSRFCAMDEKTPAFSKNAKKPRITDINAPVTRGFQSAKSRISATG